VNRAALPMVLLLVTMMLSAAAVLRRHSVRTTVS
jgi:hypothetical protein